MPSMTVRSRILAGGLAVLGIGIGVGWSAWILPAFTMAEAGPGPDFQIRLLVAAPIGVASGLLVGAGRYGVRSLEGAADASHVWRAAFIGAAAFGVLTGLGALAILFAQT
jgi:hypothetical protein